IYSRILSHFPKKDLRMAFAYGSGAYKQVGHKDPSKNMLDFIFVVDNPEAWHRTNISTNPQHYSFLRWFGPKRVSSIGDKFGAGIYFNTLVSCESRMVKYGVIKTDTLINDLLDWDTLYVSGRLQKPVQTLYCQEDKELHCALVTNHQSAVHTSLLLLPDTFTEEELYCTITGLSYNGDFRMTIGEDKNKIENIVRPNVEHFRRLYEPILKHESHLHWNMSEGTFEQSLDFMSQYHHLNLLPKQVQLGLVAHRNKDGRHRDIEEVIRSFSHDRECREVIQTCLAGIVKQSSITQSLKGIFTAGVMKSMRYSWSKLKKMMKSAR
ncbi:Phosphatidate cytidylyltransferase, mitochondrial, partial [Lamellibrachia satsuma]